MVDARADVRRDHRLGTEGDAEARRLQHRQVVGAVADSYRIDVVELELLAQFVVGRKLRFLAEYAEFDVNVNSVVGSSIRTPEDGLDITRRALGLGLSSTVGLIHDGSGRLQPLSERQQSVYQQIERLKKPFYTSALYNRFHRNLARGLPNEWHCRAGSRYLYICENGLVHYCSQQRGYPGIPLEQYTFADMEREYFTKKPCAPACKARARVKLE